jgi:hypothetical protein
VPVQDDDVPFVLTVEEAFGSQASGTFIMGVIEQVWVYEGYHLELERVVERRAAKFQCS